MTLPETRIDVAVIGAGIIGVCTALELVERGMKVTILTLRRYVVKPAMVTPASSRHGPVFRSQCRACGNRFRAG